MTLVFLFIRVVFKQFTESYIEKQSVGLKRGRRPEAVRFQNTRRQRSFSIDERSRLSLPSCKMANGVSSEINNY